LSVDGVIIKVRATDRTDGLRQSWQKMPGFLQETPSIPPGAVGHSLPRSGTRVPQAFPKDAEEGKAQPAQSPPDASSRRHRICVRCRQLPRPASCETNTTPLVREALNCFCLPTCLALEPPLQTARFASPCRFQHNPATRGQPCLSLRNVDRSTHFSVGMQQQIARLRQQWVDTCQLWVTHCPSGRGFRIQRRAQTDSAIGATFAKIGARASTSLFAWRPYVNMQNFRDSIPAADEMGQSPPSLSHQSRSTSNEAHSPGSGCR
jgi:hypothetical protein